MQNHYEVLGVPRTATAGEIKSAYRRKSSEVHPDRNGGDTALQQAVNAAYTTLRDPEKRAHYDQHGEDKKAEPTLDERAIKFLIQHFEEYLLVDGNMFAMIERAMVEGRERMEMSKRDALKQIKKLNKRRDKVKVTAGDNLVHMIIDARLAELNKGIESAGRYLNINRRALEMLKAYTQDPDDEIKHPPGGRGYGDADLHEMFAEALRGARFGQPFFKGGFNGS